MGYKNSKLEEYAEPISKSEKEQCENAIDMVKEALINYGYTVIKNRNNYTTDGYAYYYELKSYNYSSVTILVQGSYANNTNIKRYSDVDVSVIYTPIIPISIEVYFKKYKNEIYTALYKKFGNDVEKRNKSIKVKGNTYRKSIDVVPAFSLTQNLEDGIQFITDDGIKVLNYPIKQISNENQKNRLTNYKYKKYVRIFKNIKMDMENSGCISAQNIGSFQIESLLWNVNEDYFTKYSILGFGVEEIIEYLSLNKFLLDNYYESNGIKKLCGDYIIKYYLGKFIDDIKKYFEYEL